MAQASQHGETAEKRTESVLLAPWSAGVADAVGKVTVNLQIRCAAGASEPSETEVKAAMVPLYSVAGVPVMSSIFSVSTVESCVPEGRSVSAVRLNVYRPVWSPAAVSVAVPACDWPGRRAEAVMIAAPPALFVKVSVPAATWLAGFKLRQLKEAPVNTVNRSMTRRSASITRVTATRPARDLLATLRTGWAGDRSA